MNQKRNIPIKRVVSWGFGLVVLLFLLVGFTTILQINSLGSIATKIFDHPLMVSNAALRADLGVARMHRSMKDVVLAEDILSLENAIDVVSEGEIEVFRQLDVVRDLILGSEGQALERDTRKMFIEWRTIREEVFLLVKRGDQKQAIKITQGKGADHEFQLEKQVVKLTLYANNKAVGFVAQVNEVQNKSYVFVAVIVLMGALLAILIAVYTAKEIFRLVNLRKQAEDKVDAFIENAPLGMVIASSDKKLIRVNNAFCKMLGFSEEELLGKSINDVTHPDDLGLTSDYLKRIGSGEINSFETEKKYLHKSGSAVLTLLTFVFMREEKEQDSYFIAQVQDITEKKKHESERLLQSEIIRWISEGVYLIQPDGIIVYTNPKFEEMFGYDPGEMIGQHASILNCPSEKNPEEKAQEILAIIAREGVWQGEIENIKKDGTPFWCYASVITFEDANHRQVIVAVHTDITERKEAEAEKSRLESQLRQAQKMEAIGTLAGGIAHDFNNILAAVLGYAEMVRDEVPDNSQANKDIQEVLKAGARAKKLVQHILAFSRKAEQARMPVLMHLIVGEALSLLRASIPSTITIHEDIDFKCGTVFADPTQIHQVIMNLCTNAAQAMDKTGGILDVKLCCLELSNEDFPEEESMKPGQYLQLTVSDDGPGIDKGIINRIFDPYFTTKDVGKGSGMGLAVVHGIVMGHDGMVTVDSADDMGTTFKVFLPRSGDVIKQKEPGEISSLPTGNERVLVVDDEVGVAEIIRWRLEQLGYEVTLETDSLAALKLFRSQPDAFDLVISDQTMPGFTGEQLSKEIKKLRSDMPIVISTGYSSRMDAAKADFLGIGAFIMKPVGQRELAETVRRLLDKEK